MRGWLSWLAVVACAEVALFGAHAVAAAVALAPVAAYVVGFSAVTASAIATACACPRFPKRALFCLALPACALLVLSQTGASELAVAAIVTAALLLGASLLGAVVGGAIEHPGHLVFVAIVSAAADTLSLFHPSGPSAAIAQSKAALSLLALPWPMLGTRNIEPFLGAGDVVFTALYIASSRRHALPLHKTVLALALAYAVTMAAVVAFESPVPVLPLLGLAVVLAQPKARRPPRGDRVRGFTVAALVVAAVLLSLLR
jgi:hypothetical protein